MKISKKIITILMIIAISMPIYSGTTLAEEGDKITLFSNESCPVYLQFKGRDEVTPYVKNIHNGKEYPAYRLDSLLRAGVDVGKTCEVEAPLDYNYSTTWRLVINGFPYKTPEELGCNNEMEAFVATENALSLKTSSGKTMEDYTPVGEAGERVLNAMKLIYEQAENCTEDFSYAKLNIKPIKQSWKQDDTDGRYLYKEYSVSAECKFGDYTISLEKLENDLPIGIKIVDKNNEEKTQFKENENFKIRLPINSLESAGSCKIKTSAIAEVKRVKVSRRNQECDQRYAIVLDKYEQSTGEYEEKYQKNNTKIVIQEQDMETTEKLQGAQFDILDSENHIVYSGLQTDEEGKIEIKNVSPGKYYIKEIKAVEGYMPVEELTEVEVKFNEEAVIKISTKRIQKDTDENLKQGETQETPPTNLEEEEKDKNQEQNNEEENKKNTQTQKPQITVEKIKHDIEQGTLENTTETQKTKKLPITGK